MDFFKGKKTYIIVAVFVLAMIIPAATGFVVPDYVYGILAALGLGAVRLGMQAISGNKGWKTYAAALIVGLVSLANAVGWTWLPMEMVYSLAAALGVVGIRDAVEKLKE